MSQPSGIDTLPIGGSLWIFALDIYKSNGVSEACLALQDGFNTDVNLLLFGAWMGVEQNVILTSGDAERARDLVAAWHDEIVRPLRALRQKLKAGPVPAPGAVSTVLRNEIKAAELHSERIELALLEHHAESWNGNVGTDATDAVLLNLQSILALTAEQALLASAAYHLGVIAEAAHRRSGLQSG
jgi:uncharacterized protein (TIGR02444 family)